MRAFYIFSLLFINLILTATHSVSQNRDVKTILSILDRQTEAWNRGDIEQFMIGYWENDSLMYIGKGGVTYGYANTIQSYRRN